MSAKVACHRVKIHFNGGFAERHWPAREYPGTHLTEARLQLIAQDDVMAARCHLMVNVDARRDQFLPMRDAILADDEVNGIGAVPRLQDEILVQVFFLRRGALVEEIGFLVHEKNFRLK